jgi:8-amino-7-oxononanoate synthase
MSFDAKLASILEQRKKQSLFRCPYTLEGPQDSIIAINAKQFINFCSNNYLGLANDPRLKQAAIEAVKNFGTGTASSRLICGTTTLHKQLEESIAKFKHSQQALVFNSGYVANLGIISSLMGKDGIIFSDRLNHASIVDAILLSRAQLARYNHNNLEHLEELLKKHKQFKQKLIVTDTVFSMDGDTANLVGIVELAKKYDCLLMIDEAHATGVFGANGAGLAEELGVLDKIDIQMATLSKALGSFGAFVSGSKNLIDYLINVSRPLIYTTSLPPATLAASLRALEIIKNEPERRKKLWDNIKFFKENLKSIGLDCPKSNSAIIPILTKENKITMEFSQKLFNRGIFIQGIRPPTVPEGSARLRLTITATHTQSDLEQCLEAIKISAKELGLV